MKHKIKAGDKIQCIATPQIKSTVIVIKESEFREVDLYHCKNGSAYELHELKRYNHDKAN